MLFFKKKKKILGKKGLKCNNFTKYLINSFTLYNVIFHNKLDFSKIKNKKYIIIVFVLNV